MRAVAGAYLRSYEFLRENKTFTIRNASVAGQTDAHEGRVRDDRGQLACLRARRCRHCVESQTIDQRHCGGTGARRGGLRHPGSVRRSPPDMHIIEQMRHVTVHRVWAADHIIRQAAWPTRWLQRSGSVEDMITAHTRPDRPAGLGRRTRHVAARRRLGRGRRVASARPCWTPRSRPASRSSTPPTCTATAAASSSSGVPGRPSGARYHGRDQDGPPGGRSDPANYTLDNFRAWTDRSRAQPRRRHARPRAAALPADRGLLRRRGLRRARHPGRRGRDRRLRGERRDLRRGAHRDRPPGVATVQIILNAFRLKPLDEVLPAAARPASASSPGFRSPPGCCPAGTPRTRLRRDDHRTYNRHGEAFDAARPSPASTSPPGSRPRRVRRARPRARHGRLPPRPRSRWPGWPEQTASLGHPGRAHSRAGARQRGRRARLRSSARRIRRLPCATCTTAISGRRSTSVGEVLAQHAHAIYRVLSYTRYIVSWTGWIRGRGTS